jgi:hypothetical protein
MLETGMWVGGAIRYNPRAGYQSASLWIYAYLPQKKKGQKIEAG